MSEIYNENLRDNYGDSIKKLYKEVKDYQPLTKQQFDNLTNKTSLTNKEMESVVKYANSHEDWLTLNIKTLTDEQSKILGKYTGSWLNLDSLSSITDIQASNLAKFKGSNIYQKIEGFLVLND